MLFRSRATQNYTGDAATTLAADITKTAKTFEVADGSTLTANTYINIEGEQMFVTSISGNKITVRRGEDKTASTIHLGGTEIHEITAADNALIEMGDNFGFDGSF